MLVETIFREKHILAVDKACSFLQIKKKID